MTSLVSSLVLFSFLTAPSLASISFNDAAFPEVVQSARALAMAGAFVARVDDQWAPFSNPAGLGTVRRRSFNFSNLFLALGKDFAKEAGSEVGDTFKRIGGSFELDELRQYHLRDPKNFTHTQFSLTPNFTTRFLSLGYFYSHKVRTFYEGGASDPFEFATRTDHGPYIGSNFSLFGGIFKLGASLAWLNRKENRGEADISNTFSFLTNQRSKGTMLLTTVGARVIFPVVALPCLSATLHNATGSRFNRDEDFPQAPSSIKQNLSLGLSITPQISRNTKLHLEVNHKDFGRKYDVKNSKRWSLGAEFNFFRTLFLRMGLYNKSLSGGVGLRTKRFIFDLSTYAVEQDRQLAFSTSFRL